MKLLYPLLIGLAFILVGCVSPSLFEAIEKSGYTVKEILYQNDKDELVIFLSDYGYKHFL